MLSGSLSSTNFDGGIGGGWESICGSKPSEDDLSLSYDLKPRSSKDCLRLYKEHRSFLRKSDNDVSNVIAKSREHLEQQRVADLDRLRLQALGEIALGEIECSA